MEAVTILLAAIAFASFYAYILLQSKKQRIPGDKHLPPGPRGLPIIGNVFDIRGNSHKAYERFMSYGHVCMIRMGFQPMIILNSYEAIQEALVNQSDNFAGRPQSELMDGVTRKSGVVFIDGPIWKEHRRVMMRMLREFGVGKTLVEEIIKDEFNQLRERIPLNVPLVSQEFFAPTVSNVLGRLCLGERSGTDEPDFHVVIESLDLIGSTSPIVFLPVIKWLKKLPLSSWVLVNVDKFLKAWDALHAYFIKKINKRNNELHSLNPMPSNVKDATDVCDYMLIEKHRKGISENSTFTDWQVIRTVLEIYGAGIDTTVTSLTWISLILALHPEIQKKVQKEIEENIGRERLPSMTDRASLPYTCAVLDEIMRYASIVPSSLPHRVLEDTELMGYFIPAGTIVQTNLYGVHHSPKYWEKPNEFYPEHFLDINGQYQPSKYLMLFSVGKRSCAGEGLARTQLFIALVSLLQAFSFSLVHDEGVVSKEEILKGEPGLALRPKSHKIMFTKPSL